jgi:hypothetical protein
LIPLPIDDGEDDTFSVEDDNARLYCHVIFDHNENN